MNELAQRMKNRLNCMAPDMDLVMGHAMRSFT
jgi:hypothetical protein